MYTVYEGAHEEELKEWPVPKGNLFRTSTFVDANLLHCLVTGKSCVGILHFVNQTPVDWYSKLLSTVETATFGTEFMAACIATEQIIGLQATLHSMGVPLEESAWLMGDNESVITQSTIPHLTLTKRHNFLAYHKVRWAIAGKIMKFLKVKGTENPSDTMTKFMPHSEAYPVLQPILFWRGETFEQPQIDFQHCNQGSVKSRCIWRNNG